MLYIVPTPIGNLQDITLRSLEVLKQVDGIICEDSRHTSLLLNHYDIHKPLLVINDYNETNQLPPIINKLLNGEHLALVSDAGTPLISDPGFKLVKLCLQNQIPVDSLPGPSSVITALTLSGLPTDKFMFLGYLPQKPGHRKSILEKIESTSNIWKMTYVVFMPPHKLIQSLNEIKSIIGDIEVVLTKELTKIHQAISIEPISKHLEQLKKIPPKGEYILLFNLGDS